MCLRLLINSGHETIMNSNQLHDLIDKLRLLPGESECVEFKQNNTKPEEIGEYLSALSNSAAILDQEAGYIIWGISDKSQAVVGTKFKPRQEKVGNEDLESWLARLLEPRVDFQIQEIIYDDKPVVVFQVQPGVHAPVRWKGTAFIRVGSYKKKLIDYPEKERALWLKSSRTAFEKQAARADLTADEILSLIDYPAYFDMSGLNLPANKKGIMERLEAERIIIRRGTSHFDVTNLGAILFAKRLSDFEGLGRKAVRVIIYRDIDRISTIKEYVSDRGYAAGFEPLVAYINDQLPHSEQLGQALRREVRTYPELAVRELVANAMIHQDFSFIGDSPMVEIFTDRVEITNSGLPLIDTQRFIDEPPQSRNETLAGFMRRLNICEERGSGIDKVISLIELFQLPAPEFLATQKHTKAFLFAPQSMAQMDAKDRIRACYQHACLQWVSNRQMTNSSLRKRFGIEDRNYPMASRILSDTLKSGLIRPFDAESTSKKQAKYVPFWA